MTELPRPENLVRLDVWADIACPWCYIGSRHLEEALAGERAQGRDVVVTHRPFELQPTMPADGVPMREFFEAKFGGGDAVVAMFDRVVEVGRGVGIAFDFEAMPKAPNTRLAHAVVLSYAGDPRQRLVLHRLYAAYFEDGLDITRREVVAAAVREVTGETVEEVLDRCSQVADLEAGLLVARELGVDAVPLFVADAGLVGDDQLGLSVAAIAVQGAQPARTLTNLLEQARERASA